MTFWRRLRQRLGRDDLERDELDELPLLLELELRELERDLRCLRPRDEDRLPRLSGLPREEDMFLAPRRPWPRWELIERPLDDDRLLP